MGPSTHSNRVRGWWEKAIPLSEPVDIIQSVASLFKSSSDSFVRRFGFLASVATDGDVPIKEMKSMLLLLLSLIGMFWMPVEGRGLLRSPQRTIHRSETAKKVPGPEKNYTGIRVRRDSLLLVYYHEQTIAIVEASEKREIFNCELLEVRSAEDRRVALGRFEGLANARIKIGFGDMLDLMRSCDRVESPKNPEVESATEEESEGENQFDSRDFASLLKGVFPGTKWCGTGDVAASYHDLGSDETVDRCCRSHDLCPVKVSGFHTRYNVTNYSVYTKSHCDCDDVFHDCLKRIGTVSSNLLGNLYFNLGRVNCLESVNTDEADIGTARLVTKGKRF